MRRTILIAVLVLGLAVALLSLGTSSGTQDQPECTVTVQAGDSIQAAIDAAEEGAVICLAEGTWEGSLVIEKSLTLRGLGPEKSAIKGVKGGEPVILISSNTEIEVTVEGLIIAEAKGWCAKWPLRCPNGLSLGGKVKATISGNTISGNWQDGISILDSAQASISGNTISGNVYGILMTYSAQATIEGNTISGNKEDGILMAYSAQATIEGNTISGNVYGIYMWDSAQATIEGNTISGNKEDGIYMRGSAQATIEGNKITENNGYGVALFQRPCADTDLIFEGAVRGRVNEISGNKKGEVCPAELEFLMTEEGSCYGPLCGVASHVVINELELNPPCDDRTSSCLEWVELYNPTAAEVSLDGWILKTTHGETVSIPVAAYCKSISPGDYCIIARARWLDNENESLILFDVTGNEIDRTPIVSDKDNDNNSWQRCPNGQDTDSDADWLFRPSTAGEENNC
jgi:parallel beta-helix repeat protein